MENTSPPLFKRFWRTARPWVILTGVIVVMRYTGILGAVSQVSGTILLKTGIMNAPTEAPPVIRNFSYDFTLRGLDGRLLDASQLRGKVLFVNMWATWCGPCRIEMPSIQQLYEDTDTTSVVFLMISVDRQGDREKVEKYIGNHGFTFPVYTPVGALPEMLDVPSIPTTMVVSPDGKIAMQKAGAANYDTRRFRKFLQGL